MRLLAVLKSVLVLLLNMYNILEISGLFVHQGELVKIFDAWVGQKKKKNARLWFATRINTHADPMVYHKLLFSVLFFFL